MGKNGHPGVKSQKQIFFWISRPILALQPYSHLILRWYKKNEFLLLDSDVIG